MALTEAGATLLGYAQRLLDLNDEALSATSGASLNGSVTLAVPHDVAETWLPAVVEGFSRSHPSVALRTVEGRSTAVLERLAAGEIDLAVAFSAARAEDALWSGCLPMIFVVAFLTMPAPCSLGLSGVPTKSSGVWLIPQTLALRLRAVRKSWTTTLARMGDSSSAQHSSSRTMLGRPVIPDAR